MMRKISGLIVACLLLIVVSPVFAQAERKKRRAAGASAQPTAVTQVTKAVEKTNLSDEQKAKFKEVVAKHRPKLVELQKERKSLLGDETIKQMNAARKKASTEGLKGKKLAAAVHEAAKLSDEKAKQLETLTEKTQSAATAFKKDVLALLTPEQKKLADIKLPKAERGAAAARKKLETPSN